MTPFGRLLLASCACLPLLAAPVAARAALFGREGLDPFFCKMPSVRQTVVYVDDTMMVDGQTDWARKLAGKLRASLAPGERVTLVRLSPTTGQSSELWSGCWPGYSAAQRADFSGRSFLFSRNPLTDLADQQKYFLGDLGQALTAIYESARRSPDAVAVDAGHPPRKELIRALASDEGRFAASRVTVRAILYSDMAENSDLGSVFSGTAPDDLGHRLGTWLRRGVFYAFGSGADVTGDVRFPEQARAFWLTVLHGMAATLDGIGSDLNVPNLIPVAAHDYPVLLDIDRQELEGRISLLTDDEGDLVDSWIGISRLGSTGLDGTFRCAHARCRLEAATDTGLATNAASEQLVLQGPASGPLSGQLGVRAQGMSFPLHTED